MSQPLENYALLSDCHSAALVAKDGSIDWLAFPCFDSPACFASLLGNEDNGRWIISPKEHFHSHRNYINDSMVLETQFHTSSGSMKITDCMLMDDEDPTLVRIVEGLKGQVEVDMQIVIRFDYGSIIPWVRTNNEDNGIHAVAGPEALVIYSEVPLKGKNMHTSANFTINAGEKKRFTMIWHPSHKIRPKLPSNIDYHLERTIASWQAWSSKCTYQGFDKDSVKRSLITLKALTYEPTGAIIAAPTTSLPEELGGVRNWDYRYGWLRDSSFTLYALIKGGYLDEAIRWKDWLHRAVAGTPSQVNIMYGIRAERRLTEIELPWLMGYENSRPVRIGNAAYQQFQLDVFGELLGTSNIGRRHGIPIDENSWKIERHMVDYVCDHWQGPDEGIWEVRGVSRQFTHSKLMAWVALSAAVDAVETHNLFGNVEKWNRVRKQIHQDICEKGFNHKLNSFVQYYGANDLDASLLMMVHTGFLPPQDPRILGTIMAIKNHLMKDGHVIRYKNYGIVDGLPGQDGSFIPCSFWMVDALRVIGRHEEALELYRHLQTVKNDVGLYSEEFSVLHNRMVGNFPQAFTHIAEAISAMGFEENEQHILVNKGDNYAESRNNHRQYPSPSSGPRGGEMGL